MAPPGSDPDDRNAPLVDFVTGLPDLSTRNFDPDRRQAIETLAAELSTVRWEMPEHTTSFEFLLGGMAGHSLRLPERGTRVLVISPFVSAEQLAVVARLADDVTLVSRTESLDALPADALDGMAEVRVLDSDATLAGETEDTASPFEETAERVGCELSGLHAKVLVVDRGPGADFVTGSMNATSAGWGRNVEFGLLMRGGTASCGVDAVLGRDGSQPNLDSLLSRYRRPESGPVEASDEDRAALRLERIGRGLAALAFTAWVDFDDDNNRALTLTSTEAIDAPTDVAISCRPVTQSSDNAIAVTAGAPVEARFPVLSLQSLTSFFVFELATTAASGVTVTTRVVVNADLRNEPSDRLQRVLTDHLKNKGDVLRYLLLLLADGGDDGLAHLIGAITGAGWDADADERHTVDVPLLESMLRALARSPETLDPINRLITDLQATDEGRSLLPDHLDELWPAVWEARGTLR